MEGTYVDVRDGSTYKTIEIGNLTWMKQNLNYATPGSVCYENRSVHCDTYGRLYPWTEARTACPPNWRLPGVTDIEQLYNFIQTKRIDKIATGDWRIRNSTAFSNSTGLSILPAGRIDTFSIYSKEDKKWIDTLAFHQLGYAASFWLEDIATEEGLIHWHIGEPIGELKSGMHRHQISEDHKFSIRCVCEEGN